MKRIEKRELNRWEAPGDGWYVIEAAGEHPKEMTLGSGRVLHFVQRLTPEVLGRVAESPIPPEGLLVDYDHRSLTDNNTCAMGWVKELALCEGDLAARIEWTSVGRQAVRDKQYKHFSTVYPAPGELEEGGVYEPARLDGLALTNTPNNAAGQPPITNSRGWSDPGAAAGYTPDDCREDDGFQPRQGAAAKEQQTENTQKTMQYNPELLALLGLAEGATDEEVLAAVRKLAEERDAAQADAVYAAAEAVVNSEEAKEDAELTEEERKDCKEAIIANSARGLRYTQMLCREKRKAAPRGLTPAQRVLNSRNYPGVPNVAGNLLFPGAAAKGQTAGREQRSRAQQIMDEARRNGRQMSANEAWQRAAVNA